MGIGLAYSVLSDPSRRKRYDATGSVENTLREDGDGFNWSDFYQEQYRDAVSENAIQEFAAKYKGSDEEKDDLLVAYEKYKGDMTKIYESVMVSNVLEDDDRFRSILDEAIASGDVEAYKAYTKESKKAKNARVKAAKEEATEAEEYAKELGVHDKLFGGKKDKKGSKGKKGSSEDDLAALIRRNQEGRSGFLDKLAAKYAGGDEDEPSEEAFQAAAAKLHGKASSSNKRKVTAPETSSKSGRAKKAKK